MNHTGVTSVGSPRHALRNRPASGAGGNRRLACLGRSDEDGVPLELHAVDRDRQRGRAAEHLARLEREDALVPGAGYCAARRIECALTCPWHEGGFSLETEIGKAHV